MRLKNLLLIVLLSLTGLSFAQTDSAGAGDRYRVPMRGYIGLSGNLLFPTATFRSADVNDSKSGKAAMGLGSTLTIAVPAKKYFGFQVQAGTYTAFVRENEYEYQLQQQNPMYTFRVDMENYRLTTFMAGGYLTFPLGQRMAWDFKGLAGYGIGRLPYMEMTQFNPNGSVFSDYRYEERQGGGLCLSAGSTLRMSVYRKLAVFLDASYLWSAMTYKDVVTQNLTLSYASAPYVVRRRISGVNVAIGVALLMK